MTYEETNRFIKNYLENDKTGRAIMLDGSWGTGKSHYIVNELKPFIENDGNHKCVIVSLYGLADVSEICKNIYLEMRTIGKRHKSELGATGMVATKIITKTIVNGITSKFMGFDLGEIDDDDLMAVYSSINLDDTLIVLDDVDRTQIELCALLGFVNNMCEVDGVKVLLVANEFEFLKTKKENDEDDKGDSEYAKASLDYLCIKEKTVSDTIKFDCNYKVAVHSIIDMFENDDLKNVVDSLDFDEFLKVFISSNKAGNLRNLMVACQKSCDIFIFASNEKIKLNKNVKKIVFMGILGLINIISNKGVPNYPKAQFIDSGIVERNLYPLFRFCYDYVASQKLDKKALKSANKKYKEYILYDSSLKNKDPDMKVISNYYLQSEKEINKAINSLMKKINDNSLPYYNYGFLVNCLINIKYDAEIDCDVERVIKLLLDKLQKTDSKIEYDVMFSSTYTIYDEHGKKLFEDFKNEVEKTRGVYKGFGYINSLKDLFIALNSYKSKVKYEVSVFVALNVDDLIVMLQEASAKEIYELKSDIKSYYYNGGDRFIKDDKTVWKEVLGKKDALLKFEQYDKIQLMQIRHLMEDIEGYVVVAERTKI